MTPSSRAYLPPIQSKPVMATSAPPDLSRSQKYTIAAFSGMSEVLLCQGFDTTAKRWMNSNVPVTRHNAASILFQNARGAKNILRSLYQGMPQSMGYKAIQRGYNFGFKDAISPGVDRVCGPAIEWGMGTKSRQSLVSGISGAIMAVGEVWMLPLDYAKVQAQINGISFTKALFQTPITSLYRGIQPTMMRNGIGGFSTFLVHEASKQELSRYSPTQQQLMAAVLAGTARVLVPAPFDTIKTRMQGGHHSGSFTQVTRSLIKEEGVLALYKGTLPKVLAQGSKFALGLFIYEHLKSWILAGNTES
tara:strand:- start:258 stop:1172 length:915 start_codon:yes stop_codon:yes gene_type:complete